MQVEQCSTTVHRAWGGEYLHCEGIMLTNVSENANYGARGGSLWTPHPYDVEAGLHLGRRGTMAMIIILLLYFDIVSCGTMATSCGTMAHFHGYDNDIVCVLSPMRLLLEILPRTKRLTMPFNNDIVIYFRKSYNHAKINKKQWEFGIT